MLTILEHQTYNDQPILVSCKEDAVEADGLNIYSRYHFRYGPGKAYTKGTYANDDEYFADVAKAYQTELKILYDAGLRNAQVDDPNLACESLLLKVYVHPQC